MNWNHNFNAKNHTSKPRQTKEKCKNRKCLHECNANNQLGGTLKLRLRHHWDFMMMHRDWAERNR